MANISELLNTIRTAIYGRNMREALHDSIKLVNDDVDTLLSRTVYQTDPDATKVQEFNNDFFYDGNKCMATITSVCSVYSVNHNNIDIRWWVRGKPIGLKAMYNGVTISFSINLPQNGTSKIYFTYPWLGNDDHHAFFGFKPTEAGYQLLKNYTDNDEDDEYYNSKFYKGIVPVILFIKNGEFKLYVNGEYIASFSDPTIEFGECRYYGFKSIGEIPSSSPLIITNGKFLLGDVIISAIDYSTIFTYDDKSKLDALGYAFQNGNSYPSSSTIIPFPGAIYIVDPSGDNKIACMSMGEGNGYKEIAFLDRYATDGFPGVIRVNSQYGTYTDIMGNIKVMTMTYNQYKSSSFQNDGFISKGTLDNILSALTANRSGYYGIEFNQDGSLISHVFDYPLYNSSSVPNQFFISKGTLNNVIQGKKLSPEIIKMYTSSVDILMDALDNTDIRSLAESISAINILFPNDVYPEDYCMSFCFNSGETPTTISYNKGGIINWVGDDCSVVKVLIDDELKNISLFQPDVNKHYEITVWFNGVNFVGRVIGYEPAYSNYIPPVRNYLFRAEFGGEDDTTHWAQFNASADYVPDGENWGVVESGKLMLNAYNTSYGWWGAFFGRDGVSGETPIILPATTDNVFLEIEFMLSSIANELEILRIYGTSQNNTTIQFATIKTSNGCKISGDSGLYALQVDTWYKLLVQLDYANKRTVSALSVVNGPTESEVAHITQGFLNGWEFTNLSYFTVLASDNNTDSKYLDYARLWSEEEPVI